MFAGTQFHGSDLRQTIFTHAELQDYLINFVNHLDPNVGANSESESPGKLIYWPRFTDKSKDLLNILDGPVPLNITKDDYREEPISFLINLGPF
jgi:hypothetical protein